MKIRKENKKLIKETVKSLEKKGFDGTTEEWVLNVAIEKFHSDHTKTELEDAIGRIFHMWKRIEKITVVYEKFKTIQEEDYLVEMWHYVDRMRDELIELGADKICINGKDKK